MHAHTFVCSHPCGGEREGIAAKSLRSDPQPGVYGEDLLYAWGASAFLPTAEASVGAEFACKAQYVSSPLLGAGRDSKRGPSAAHYHTHWRFAASLFTRAGGAGSRYHRKDSLDVKRGHPQKGCDQQCCRATWQSREALASDERLCRHMSQSLAK